jgi:hypothetical protein
MNMEHEEINPGQEQGQSQPEQERKIIYGPLIGSGGEVSGYDWD